MINRAPRSAKSPYTIRGPIPGASDGNVTIEVGGAPFTFRRTPRTEPLLRKIAVLRTLFAQDQALADILIAFVLGGVSSAQSPLLDPLKRLPLDPLTGRVKLVKSRKTIIAGRKHSKPR